MTAGAPDPEQRAREREVAQVRSWLLGTASAGFRLLAAVADLTHHESTDQIARSFRQVADAYEHSNLGGAARVAKALGEQEATETEEANDGGQNVS
jgi:hypothetical protein